MKKMKIREIVEVTNAKLIVVGDCEAILEKEVSHITQDSRTVTAESMYVAIIGERLDGHEFIMQAFADGTLACLSEREMTPPEGSALLLVADVRKALLALAKHYKEKFPIPYIGITGSVGKTTTKDMVASVLSQKYNTLYTQGNYNNDIGVPLTLFRLADEHEIAVIEMGMNHFGEIHALAEVVRPQVGLISNVGVAHIEFLGSREGIMQAKCELFDFMGEDGVAILNADNDMLQTLEGKLPQKIHWFGVENQKDIYADNLEVLDLEKTKCTLHSEKGSIEVIIPLPGMHMVQNALSAAAVGLEFGLTLAEIKAGIEAFVPTKNRMNVIKCDNGMVILNDVYNANPVSVKASLDILAQAENRKVAILGYMGELGEFAPEMHEEVGSYVGGKKIDLLCFIGKLGEFVEKGARESGLEEVYLFETQDAFLETGLSLLLKSDTILVKGSRSMALERTVEKMQGVN